MPTVCTFLRSGGHCDVNVVPVNYEVLDFWHFFRRESKPYKCPLLREKNNAVVPCIKRWTGVMDVFPTLSSSISRAIFVMSI